MTGRGVPRRRGRPSKVVRLGRSLPAPRPPKALLSKEDGVDARSEASQSGMDFGRETERWKQLKVQHDLDSDEDVAKLLLDLWDSNKKFSSIQVGPATVRDFKNFQSRTNRSADELVRFFLRLGVEPGQNVIVFAEHITKMFESLKAKLCLNNNELMNYLLDVYDKHLKKDKSSMFGKLPAMDKNEDPMAACLDKTVRRAIREELIQLVHEGILPAAVPSLTNSLQDSSAYNNANMSESSSVQFGASGSAVKMVVNGSNASQLSPYKQVKPTQPSPETSAKKRSRKSLPQRVVVNPSSEMEAELSEVMNSSQGFGQSSVLGTPQTNDNDVITIDDMEVMQYNYVMSAPATSTPISGDLVVPKPEVSALTSALNAPVIFTPPAPVRQETEKELEAQGIFTVGLHTVTRDSEAQLKCPLCDYKSPMIARLRRHFTLHTGKAFNCSKCDRSYTEEYKLKEHFQVKHIKNVHYKCEQCDRDFTSKGGLRYHMKTIHRKDFPYWCEKCSKGFKQSLFYDWHMKKHNDPQQFKCNICMKEFSYLATLSMHKKTCFAASGDANINTLACEMCGDVFSSDKLLEEHISSEHCDVSRYLCTCGQEFRWKSAYDNHRLQCGQKKATETTEVQDVPMEENKVEEDGLQNVAIINVESLYKGATLKPLVFDEDKSKSTNVDFDSNSMDSIQVTNVLSGEQFTCDLTGEADEEREASPAVNVEATNQSLDTDTNTPPVSVVIAVGDDAIRVFSQSSIPGGPETHSCSVCNYSTTKMSHMRRHIATHTGKKHRCVECPKSFSDASKLKSHQLAKHQGHARYKCDKCSRTFSSKGGIMYHQQTKHNNSYKYKCETCEKGFNTIQHYLGHKNTHSGVRPFVCDKCNLGFAYPSVLTSHKRVCKGKIAGVDMNGQLDYYPCKQCKEKFAMLSSLEQHVQEAHGSETGNRYMCDCGAMFELQALFDLHKSNCVLVSKSVEVIRIDMMKDDDSIATSGVEASTSGVGTSAGDGEFNVLTQEKFDAIVSNQPVFPT